MPTHNQSHYIKIGLFVITGLALLMVIIFVLGSGLFKKPALLAETYLNESVKGIRIGAPLQARGVPLGRVKSIEFVNAVYGDQIDRDNPSAVRATHYVRIVLAFDKLPAGDNPSSLSLQDQVKSGLRVRMISQGITGLSNLDLDFFDDDETDDLPVYWTPQYPYVPAMPSAMTRLNKSVDSAIEYAKQIDLIGTMHKVDDTLTAVQHAIEPLNTAQISAGLTNLIDKIGTLADTAQALLQQKDLHLALADIPPTLASLRTQLDTTLPQTLQSFRALADKDLPATLAALQTTATAATDLLNNSAPPLLDLTPQLQTLLQNLNDLTTKLKDQPSLLIFSAPRDDGAN